jgi:hypothetical protein
MDQPKLMSLLMEASAINCSWSRRIEIQHQLNHALLTVGDDNVCKIDENQAGMRLILEKLYVETYYYN